MQNSLVNQIQDQERWECELNDAEQLWNSSDEEDDTQIGVYLNSSIF